MSFCSTKKLIINWKQYLDRNCANHLLGFGRIATSWTGIGWHCDERRNLYEEFQCIQRNGHDQHNFQRWCNQKAEGKFGNRSHTVFNVGELRGSELPTFCRPHSSWCHGRCAQRWTRELWKFAPKCIGAWRWIVHTQRFRIDYTGFVLESTTRRGKYATPLFFFRID